MIIYWSMIFVIVFVGIISLRNPRMVGSGNYENEIELRIRLPYAVIIMGYIIFWSGIRSGYVDTSAYITTFENIPLGDMNVIKEYLSTYEKDLGFYYFSALFKNYISDNYHMWLFVIALISGVCIMRVFYKHSSSFMFSMYLFMTTATFTWLMNGIRQFLAVCILFAFSDWLAEKKTLRYIILILIVSTIHQTALIMLPVCILLRSEEPWNPRMIFFIILTVIGVFYADQLTDIFAETIGTDYKDQLEAGIGTSLIRTMVAAVPAVIAFWRRKIIASYNNRFINLCVNMTVISAAFYIVSSFTNGVLVGRIPIYFSLYDLILLPWMLQFCFHWRDRRTLKLACIGCYLIYFYFQMYIAGSAYYISDLTGLIR